MNSLKLFSLAILITLLTSCTTLVQQTEDQLERGDALGAVDTYGRALSRDPENLEAKVGLSKARRRYIDQALIQVRLLRLSGNFAESERLFRDVIAKEGQWGEVPTGVVFSTQQEELNYYVTRVTQEIRGATSSGLPLKAQSQLEKHREVFESTLKVDISNLQAEIQKEGRKFCLDVDASLKPSEHYTALWLKQTCSKWKVTLVDRLRNNSIQLFSDVEPKFKIEGLKPELSSVITSDLQTNFKLSKWYDAKSKTKLPLNIHGSFKSSDNASKIVLARNYTVQEVYWDSYVRKKSPNSSSPGLLGSLLTIIFLSSDYENVSDNHDGTETVRVKRYRDVPRVHHYPAVRYHQSKSLKLEIESQIAASPFKKTFVNSLEEDVYEHNENFPDIGLTPQPLKLMPDDEWIKLSSRSLYAQISSDLSQFWRERFCGEENEQHGREGVFRCLYGLDTNDASFVSQYFQKEYGLEPRVAISMKGI